jgi:hypothetical protein
MESRTEGKPTPAGRPAPAGKPAPAGPPRKPSKKRRGKIGYKELLVAIIVIVVIWQVGKAVTGSGSKNQPGGVNAGSSATPSQAGGPSLMKPAPTTPAPEVTIGGHPVAAGGGPMILANPGMVSPGGYVTIDGSGFTPGSTVAVFLKTTPQSGGTMMGSAKATKWGTSTVVFKMPSTATGESATVVAQQQNGNATGKTATAQIMTPLGIGQVTIDGKSAGKPGQAATISASGFGHGEKVNVYWGRVAGTPVTTLTASPAGTIGEAVVPVGIAPVGPTTLVLVGQTTHTTATAPYQMLGLYPSVVPHPYAVKAGHSVTVTGTGFAPNEQVLFYLNAASGQPALAATASAGGAMSLSFMVPFGLKGQQTLTAVGDESRASVDSGFTVLPYSPSAQASTYGAMPGTNISFYATGFAANEVVEVYTGRGKGANGTLVTAFRVSAKGTAADAGNYILPNMGGAEVFTLVGQESGGVTTAKVTVTAPPGGGQVSVPAQAPYVLPPSLGGAPTAAPSAPAAPGQAPAGGASKPAAKAKP